MEPMTRARANADGTPGKLAAEYYAQRSSVGLVVTEGTQPCRTVPESVLAAIEAASRPGPASTGQAMASGSGACAASLHGGEIDRRVVDPVHQVGERDGRDGQRDLDQLALRIAGRLHGFDIGSGHRALRGNQRLHEAQTTDVLCGRFCIAGSSSQLLLRHLPARLVVHSVQADLLPVPGQDAQASVAGSRLARLIELMREEALEQGPGSEAMLNHFSGALFGLALRLGSLVDNAPRGLLALARNRQLQPALAALFERPGEGTRAAVPIMSAVEHCCALVALV